MINGLYSIYQFFSFICFCFIVFVFAEELISKYKHSKRDYTIQETLPCFEKYDMICLEKQEPCIIVKNNEFVLIDSNSNFISYYKERTIK